MKGYILLALITIAYMVVEYYYRGYFALGAEIAFVPLGIIFVHYRNWVEEDE